MSGMIYEKDGHQYIVPSVDVTEVCKEAHDKFWDMIQDFGNRVHYAYAFRGWNAEEIKPRYKVVPNGGSAAMTFARNSALKIVRATDFDFSKIAFGETNKDGAYSMFMSCTALETVEDIGIPKNCCYDYAFASCSSLKTISILRVDKNTTFNNTFMGCKA